MKFGTPFIFELHYSYDFNAVNKGFGIRTFFGSSLLGASSSVGIGADALLRTPIGQCGSSAFVGVNGSVLFLINNFPDVLPQANGLALFLGLLLGVQFELGQGWLLELEFQPVAVFLPNNAAAQFVPAQTFPLGVNTRF